MIRPATRDREIRRQRIGRLRSAQGMFGDRGFEPSPRSGAGLQPLPTRLVSPWTGLAHRPSCYRHRQARAEAALTGRATSVPFTAVVTGPERTPTDNDTVAVTSLLTICAGCDRPRTGFASR